MRPPRPPHGSATEYVVIRCSRLSLDTGDEEPTQREVLLAMCDSAAWHQERHSPVKLRTETHVRNIKGTGEPRTTWLNGR